MTEGVKIAITAGLTAIGGVVVFVIGQIVQKWFIDPIQEKRKLVGEIVHSIHFYANLPGYVYIAKKRPTILTNQEKIGSFQLEHIRDVTSTAMTKFREATKTLRDLSAQIHKNIQVIPLYPILEKLRIVRKREDLVASTRCNFRGKSK